MCLKRCNYYFCIFKSCHLYIFASLSKFSLQIAWWQSKQPALMTAASCSSKIVKLPQASPIKCTSTIPSPYWKQHRFKTMGSVLQNLFNGFVSGISSNFIFPFFSYTTCLIFAFCSTAICSRTKGKATSRKRQLSDVHVLQLGTTPSRTQELHSLISKIEQLSWPFGTTTDWPVMSFLVVLDCHSAQVIITSFLKISNYSFLNLQIIED